MIEPELSLVYDQVVKLSDWYYLVSKDEKVYLVYNDGEVICRVFFKSDKSKFKNYCFLVLTGLQSMTEEDKQNSSIYGLKVWYSSKTIQYIKFSKELYGKIVCFEYNSARDIFNKSLLENIVMLGKRDYYPSWVLDIKNKIDSKINLESKKL